MTEALIYLLVALQFANLILAFRLYRRAGRRLADYDPY